MRWGSWPYDLVPGRYTFILHLSDPLNALRFGSENFRKYVKICLTYFYVCCMILYERRAKDETKNIDNTSRTNTPTTRRS